VAVGPEQVQELKLADSFEPFVIATGWQQVVEEPTSIEHGSQLEVLDFEPFAGVPIIVTAVGPTIVVEQTDYIGFVVEDSRLELELVVIVGVVAITTVGSNIAVALSWPT